MEVRDLVKGVRKVRSTNLDAGLKVLQGPMTVKLQLRCYGIAMSSGPSSKGHWIAFRNWARSVSVLRNVFFMSMQYICLLQLRLGFRPLKNSFIAHILAFQALSAREFCNSLVNVHHAVEALSAECKLLQVLSLIVLTMQMEESLSDNQTHTQTQTQSRDQAIWMNNCWTDLR